MSGVWPAPSLPLDVARRLLTEVSAPDGLPRVSWWRSGFWRAHRGSWDLLSPKSADVMVYDALEHATYLDKDGRPTPWPVSRAKVGDVLHALPKFCSIPDNISPPHWITPAHPQVQARHLIPCENGLVHYPTRTLIEHTPALFNLACCPFAFDAAAGPPFEWLAFLDTQWRDDPAQVLALQEFFGYVLSGSTRLHKALLLVGPTRAGKGVIERILRKLIGPENTAGISLTGMAGTFGLWPLLGKSLGIIADARFGGAGQSVVVERLLNITGEDAVLVDRKYQEPWSGKLLARLVILSNELPALADASGALAGRFLTLRMSTSFYDREDLTLEDRLTAELPAILLWALDGLIRLEAQGGRFTAVRSTEDAMRQMRDSASPVGAFVREQCDITDPAATAGKPEMFNAWKSWADENGHRTGDAARFGRNLRAAVPGIREERPREDGDRARRYVGIKLRPVWSSPAPVADMTEFEALLDMPDPASLGPCRKCGAQCVRYGEDANPLCGACRG